MEQAFGKTEKAETLPIVQSPVGIDSLQLLGALDKDLPAAFPDVEGFQYLFLSDDHRTIQFRPVKEPRPLIQTTDLGKLEIIPQRNREGGTEFIVVPRFNRSKSTIDIPDMALRILRQCLLQVNLKKGPSFAVLLVEPWRGPAAYTWKNISPRAMRAMAVCSATFH